MSTERERDLLRPVVVMDYSADDVWMCPVSDRVRRPARLRNTGAAKATRVAISDLILNESCWCCFAGVTQIDVGETVEIEPVWYYSATGGGARPAMLTQLISKTVVGGVLAGRKPAMRWRVHIDYEDSHRTRYVSVCEIQVSRLPLEVRSLTTAFAQMARPTDLYRWPVVS